MEIVNGVYKPVDEEGLSASTEAVPPKRACWGWRWWLLLIALGGLIGVVAVVLIKWVVPVLANKVVIPFIRWEMHTVDGPILALVLFATISIFPTILLPSSPSMWMAGLSFGYELGFVLVMAGIAIGVTLPYFIGSLFLLKVQKWLGARYPEQASVLRLAGEGSWFDQFKAVVLIRVSPFPYIVFNYAVVATNIAYVPYLLGTFVGVIPEVFLSLYSGILVRAIAEASDDHKTLSKPPTPFNVITIVPLLASLAATVMIGMFAKSKLDGRRRQYEDEENSLLG